VRLGGSASLNMLPEGETTRPTQGDASAEDGEIRIGARSYVVGDSAEKVATIADEEGKCTWGESMDAGTAMEKQAANGNRVGERGNGVGRLRIDLDDTGDMRARAGDFTLALNSDCDAIAVVIRKGS
jgi:hypothetical protein